MHMHRLQINGAIFKKRPNKGSIQLCLRNFRMKLGIKIVSNMITKIISFWFHPVENSWKRVCSPPPIRLFNPSFRHFSYINNKYTCRSPEDMTRGHDWPHWRISISRTSWRQGGEKTLVLSGKRSYFKVLYFSMTKSKGGRCDSLKSTRIEGFG